MANEQTSVPLFVADTILTAAQQNISAGTGVPVFATTVTRDAAFGGASEKVLAEGQLCYLSASNIVQYYDGAAWATVGPAAAAGLAVVKAETAFTSVTTVTADNVFTSTYTNYKIMITQTTVSGTSMVEQLRVGGVTTTANYDFQGLDINNTTVSPGRTTASSSFGIGTGQTAPVSVVFDFFQPNLAAATGVIAVTAGISSGNVTSIYHTGRQTAATAFDGIIFTWGAASTGTYTIYGYGKSL